MAVDIAYIHNNKLAKWNREYIGRDGIVYIGQRDGRLKRKDASYPDVLAKEIATSSIVTQAIGSNLALDDLSDVQITSVSQGDVLSYNASTQTWENTTINQTITITGRAGDIEVVTSGTSYEIKNSIIPFLLMGA